MERSRQLASKHPASVWKQRSRVAVGARQVEHLLTGPENDARLELIAHEQLAYNRRPLSGLVATAEKRGVKLKSCAMPSNV